MKTSLLKYLGSIAATFFLMTSCLGDGESSYDAGRDFVYITETEYFTKVAAASPGYIAHEVINNLQVGECYFISYKIKGSSNGGIYKAEKAEVLDNGVPVPKGYFYWNKKPMSNVPEEQRNDTVATRTLSLGAAYPNTYINDMWLFNYNISLKEGDLVVPYFYYDATNQKDDLGKDLGENKIVIDVRFIKTESGNSTGSASVVSKSSVVSLSELRKSYSPNYNGVNQVSVPIRFRYHRYEADDKPATVQWIGSWSIENAFFMIFSKE